MYFYIRPNIFGYILLCFCSMASACSFVYSETFSDCIIILDDFVDCNHESTPHLHCNIWLDIVGQTIKFMLYETQAGIYNALYTIKYYLLSHVNPLGYSQDVCNPVNCSLDCLNLKDTIKEFLSANPIHNPFLPAIH